MGKWRTVIFDMGNVLISFNNEKGMKQIAALTYIPLEILQALLLENGLGRQYEKGEISSYKLYQILSEKAPKPFSFGALLQAGSAIFTERPEMIKTVKQLKNQGLRLLLLSNTNEAHFDYIARHYDFLSLFDSLILSFRLRCVKPEKEIYEAALKEAKAPAKECFYIDDIREYVFVARELGIEGHVYKSFPNFISSLKDKRVLS